MSPVASAAGKAALAGFVTVMVLLRMRRSKVASMEGFGLVRPAVLPTLLFLVPYLGWMLASDMLLIHWRGPWDFRPWQSAPLLASGLRILAVCLLGPCAEELLFRGLFFTWLRQWLPVGAVIAVTAVGWAVLHWDYPWPVIGVIVVDGLMLGLARWRTGSVVPPIIMHVLYNLYAIW